MGLEGCVHLKVLEIQRSVDIGAVWDRGLCGTEVGLRVVWDGRGSLSENTGLCSSLTMSCFHSHLLSSLPEIT